MQSIVDAALNDRVVEVMGNTDAGDVDVSEAFQEELLKHPVIPGKLLFCFGEANLFVFGFRLEEKHQTDEDLQEQQAHQEEEDTEENQATLNNSEGPHSAARRNEQHKV